jgi:hypothetical protein
MSDRNTGEFLPRQFPRLQRTRRCRGRTSNTDFKRRTPKCAPFPYRAASGLPPFLPAAASFSNSSTCWRRPPSYIHRYRDTLGTTSTSSATPSLHVATFSNILQCGLPTAASANCRSQAQSSRRLATRARSGSRAAAQPLRTNGKRLTTAPESAGLLPSTISAAANPAIYFTSHASSSSPQYASQ